MAYPLSKYCVLHLPEKWGFVGNIDGLENIPDKGPFIFVANHDHSIDAYLLYAPIIRRINKKVHIFANPVNRGGRILQFFFKFLAWWWAEVIVVDKSNRARSLETAKSFLRKGELVGIFPEYIDTDAHRLARGKTGAVRLALAAKVPIVPVGSYGGPNVEGIRASIRYFRKHKDVKQHIRIGKPYELTQYYDRVPTYEVLAEATIDMMQRIAKLCGKEYVYTKRQWMEGYRKRYNS